MGKENKSDFLKNILTNVYVKNILLMAIVGVVLVALALLALNLYTKHNQTVKVPSLKGMQVEDANAIVRSANLRCEVIDSIFQKGGVPGSILEQIPAGDSHVKEGRTIYLTVQSVSEPMVAVPDLVDSSLRQSETLLNTLGFINITIVYIPSEYRDLVYSIEYKGAKLKAGQRIPKGSPLTIKAGNGISTATDSLTDDLEDEIVLGETF